MWLATESLKTRSPLRTAVEAREPASRFQDFGLRGTSVDFKLTASLVVGGGEVNSFARVQRQYRGRNSYGS